MDTEEFQTIFGIIESCGLKLKSANLLYQNFGGNLKNLVKFATKQNILLGSAYSTTKTQKFLSKSKSFVLSPTKIHHFCFLKDHA